MHSSCVLLQEAFAATRADLNILTQVGDRWWKQRLRLHCEMPRADQLAVLFHLSVCSICAERLKQDCCDSLDCPWSAKVVGGAIHWTPPVVSMQKHSHARTTFDSDHHTAFSLQDFKI